MLETADGLKAIEIKSGTTYAADWHTRLLHWQRLAGDESACPPWIVFGGDGDYERDGCRVRG